MIKESKLFIPERLFPQDLWGNNDQNLKIIKAYLPELQVVARGSKVILKGTPKDVDTFEQRFELLIRHLDNYAGLTPTQTERIMSLSDEELSQKTDPNGSQDIILHTHTGRSIRPKTPSQLKMYQSIKTHDLLFAIGAAGTGKTYLAVALAVAALKAKEIKRIILTRPAVEAGENLGFLPGDLQEKLDPYLQPLYDALEDMIPKEKLNELMDRRIIQIAPLAFMRGRTLSNAFVILDEAQNTTTAQMKMFLTRMGHRTKFIITGDPGQIDLPTKVSSGLLEALDKTREIDQIQAIRFNDSDNMRHPLVKQIVTAYEGSK